MKRLLMPLAGVPVFIGLSVVAGSSAHAQTSGNSGPVIVAEPSALGQKLGHDRATKGTSVVTLPSRGQATSLRALPGVKEGPFCGNSRRRYFLTDLGTLGGTQSFAYALNDASEVVGESSIAGDTASHAFLYSRGQMKDLYPLNSQDLQTVGPTGINIFGQIASGVISNNVYLPAILNSAIDYLSLIGSLGGVTSYGFNGVATSINNFGQAVGYSYIDSTNRHAFLYSNNTMQDIGSFGGYSAASGINDEGTIVGFASNPVDGVAHAFVYANGSMTNIYPAAESYANSVNDFGQVVGQFLTPDQTAFDAFLYNQGFFTDLGFAGDAMAINDEGQIVGFISLPKAQQHAVLYEHGAPFDLNSLIPKDRGWELTWAFGINNFGRIAGYGLVNGNFHAFLLTPAISHEQCYDDGWKTFGFKNQGQCVRFVNNGR